VVSSSSTPIKPLRRRYSIDLLKKLVSAAKGRLKSSLILRNVNLVDVIVGDIREGVNVAVWGEYVVRVGYFDINRYRGSDTVVIDGSRGEVAVPGFIEPHIHIESSLLTVQEFARAVMPHGTTTVAADPHEIGNVLGVRGVKLFIEESRHTPLRVFFYIPSCVPPTSLGLDTPGEVIGPEDVRDLIGAEEVIGLGEVMDFIGVTSSNEDVLRKVVYAKEVGKLVDGHAPQLPEEVLVPYVVVGIEGDHESTFLDEALMKLRNGMRVLIREGSAWRDLEELSKMLTYMKVSTRYLSFASDDLEVLDIIREGHMDRILRRAVSLGIDPITAVQMATINTAEYLGLAKELGAITPGRFADIVILERFRQFRVRDVIIGGKVMVSDGKLTIDSYPRFKYPGYAYRTMNIKRDIGPDDLALKVGVESGRAKVVAVKVVPGKAVTKKEVVELPIVNGYLELPRGLDIAYAATIERHHGTGNIGRGFVVGLGLSRGAIAQSVAHDVHNVVVVGKSLEEMVKAVNEVAGMGGGMAAVSNGVVLGSLPLPIAGLISDKPYEDVARELSSYIESLKLLNINYHAAFMTIALLSLPVIPEVRITDRGVVDVIKGRIIDPIIEIKED